MSTNDIGVVGIEPSGAGGAGVLTIAGVNDSVLDLIGNTPLVDVSQLSPEPRRAHPRQAREPEPVRVGQGPHRQGDDRGRREATATSRPGQTIVEPSSGNTGIALAAIARHQGLPDQDPAARERVDRAPPDARGVRRRDHPHAGRRGLERRRARGPRRWPPSTPSGASSTSTATTPTRGPTTRAPGPRSGGTARRSPTSSPASARAAR